MSIARKLREHFVLPAGDHWPAGHADEREAERAHRGAVETREAQSRAPVSVAVLSAPSDVEVVGAGIALALPRAARGGAAVVCAWAGTAPPGTAWRAPGLPAARRLAAALGARGHDARASGRVTLVRLAVDGDAAASEARRVIAAAGVAPTVVALGGPRCGDAFDELLSEQDLVVVAARPGDDPALAELALDALAGSARRVCLSAVPAAGAARALASAGVALLPSARGPLAAVTEALA